MLRVLHGCCRFGYQCLSLAPHLSFAHITRSKILPRKRGLLFTGVTVEHDPVAVVKGRLDIEQNFRILV